ncbi:hypothetical protein DDZ18_06725 [Marinicauda salina]|jgi:hypothetical protein|uniref:DUF6249 domain-containing protein n=1 Tax=Marinicauda salina TaxID=2135793 RepID=A0A2U2BTP5_9PROT|nr:DUF6249 domain-containing protein [Marinicauda salina]PWE17373.1 hypothetical protein DDZ18_06725 [Marinicauda salina]
MGPDIVVPVSLFLMVVAIVWVSMHFASKNRQNVLETVREAARSGQQLTPETIRALGMPKKTGGGDLKAGAIMIAIALALLVLGGSIAAVEPEEASEVMPIMAGVAAFPGFIGVVLLVFGWFNREKRGSSD